MKGFLFFCKYWGSTANERVAEPKPEHEPRANPVINQNQNTTKKVFFFTVNFLFQGFLFLYLKNPYYSNYDFVGVLKKKKLLYCIQV